MWRVPDELEDDLDVPLAIAAVGREALGQNGDLQHQLVANRVVGRLQVLEQLIHDLTRIGLCFVKPIKRDDEGCEIR